MSVTDLIIRVCGMACGVALMLWGIVSLILHATNRNRPTESLVWRRVVRREQEDQDEIVTLECGHIVRIVNLHRPSFPCAMCQRQIEELKRIHALEGK